MKKSSKKVLSAILTAAMAMSLSVPAFAAAAPAEAASGEQTLSAINAPYEQIIANLNAEYHDEMEQYGGLSIHLMDNFDARSLNLSPEEFEAQARTDLEDAIANNKRVIEQYESHGGKFADIEWLPMDNADEIAAAKTARSTQAYQRTERSQYHHAILTATLYLNPSNGNLTFETINKIQSIPNYMDPAFYSYSQKHRLIDGARTCEVTFTGQVFLASGYIVDDYESIIEFYAANNDLL